jgi:hypothetical protein
MSAKDTPYRPERSFCANCGRSIGLRWRRGNGRRYWTHENSKGNRGKGCKNATPQGLQA